MKRYCILLCFLVLWSLTGCQKAKEPGEQGEGYQIYYLNSGMTKLVPQLYKTEITEPAKLVDELMAQFISVPADIDCQSALPEKISYQRSKLDNMVLYLYFDSSYNSMKAPREVLCRAALVKTLTQISGVDFVSIYAGEQPLIDSVGNPVGVLSATDFIENISDVNAYEKSELILYFADETGEKLLTERREVVHNINISLEKLVLQELINGPSAPGYFPTLPKDLKLLNVSVNEGVCYINFDSTFLTSTADVKDYIPIYSITNSLSELATISKVQISVNGSLDVTYRDNISLNALFERNLDYIGGTEN